MFNRLPENSIPEIILSYLAQSDLFACYQTSKRFHQPLQKLIPPLIDETNKHIYEQMSVITTLRRPLQQAEQINRIDSSILTSRLIFASILTAAFSVPSLHTMLRLRDISFLSISIAALFALHPFLMAAIFYYRKKSSWDNHKHLRNRSERANTTLNEIKHNKILLQSMREGLASTDKSDQTAICSPTAASASHT